MAQVQVRRIQETTHEAAVRGHKITVDEPVASGGNDRGPTPHELLATALAACTAMTLRMYAERKGWPLEDAQVHVAHRKKDDGSAAFDRTVTLAGPLDADQRARLLEIASKCPVHKTLTGAIEIPTTLA